MPTKKDKRRRKGRKPRKPRPKKPARLRLEYIEAGSLTDNPENWRRHGDEQLGALRELLDDDSVGWAGALLFNERTGRLIDGHARKAVVSPETLVPVLVGSWTPEAERKILLSLDPLAAMADQDPEALAGLLDQVEFDTPSLVAMSDGLAEGLAELPASTERGMSELVPLHRRTIAKPPAMTWVLVGIPTVRFGEIAEVVEGIAGRPDLFCEVVANDG